MVVVKTVVKVMVVEIKVAEVANGGQSVSRPGDNQVGSNASSSGALNCR